VIRNAQVTDPAPKAKSYAFCADNLFHEELIPKVQDVDLLYHETTYLKDLPERAMARFHATTHHAATIAQLANAKKLLIGHFSSKYDKLEQFEVEAKEIFPNTELALEGATYFV
jgi:ribonuclease Z